jgi:glucose-6-phosphate dehydrogenase assembly protein OpcA
VIAATLDQQVPPLLAAEVAADPGNPTADLIAAWLSRRLEIPVRRADSAGPGITGVLFNTSAGELSLTRTDGRTAVLSWPGRPDRSVALHRREVAELLAEELRRLDPDEVYAETLQSLGSFSAPIAPWTADA